MTVKQKIEQLKIIFNECSDAEQKYSKIMELGKLMPPLDAKYKTSNCLIYGCQSTTYVYSYLKDNQLHFLAESDALISAGLASLLITIYSGEKPETILKTPPIFLKELGIQDLLSPSRANGLFYMYEKIKKDALALSQSPSSP
jgi:cysteine desulfuration protein SufE